VCGSDEKYTASGVWRPSAVCGRRWFEEREVAGKAGPEVDTVSYAIGAGKCILGAALKAMKDAILPESEELAKRRKQMTGLKGI